MSSISLLHCGVSLSMFHGRDFGGERQRDVSGCVPIKYSNDGCEADDPVERYSAFETDSR